MKNIFKRIIIERQEWLSTVHPVKRIKPLLPNGGKHTQPGCGTAH